ncbi:MAG: ABC transporter permease [Steroidobacter sp.]
MNAATETLATPIETRATRPFLWLVRRELWENRSLYIAPLIAAGVVFIGFLLNALHLPQGMQVLAALDPERQRQAVSGIYGGIGVLIVLTMAVVTWFYMLDALYSERRDRSILFWKSLPVSDTQTVLSKLFTAMVVAPVIALAVIVTLQVLILILSSIVVVIGGADPAPIWTNLQLFQMTGVLLYTLVVLSLWYAPVYAWLLLVSAWAKKSTFLWAVLPPVALWLFEQVAFHSDHVGRLLSYRLQDGFETAFDARVFQGGGDRGRFETDVRVDLPDHPLQLLDPGQFLSNPWLWVGLAVAAALIGAAIWMRRYREPI